MAWVCLRHALKTKIRPWISSGKDRFDTLDQLFDCAAASEFNPDDKLPGGQQQQRQAGESQKGRDKKRKFQPSNSEPAGSTSANSNTSNNPDTGNSKSVKSNKPSRGSRANYKQRRGFQRKSTKAERQTSKVLAAAAEIIKPTLYQIYMATCSESKHKSTAVQ
jgi:hypothetical protein